MIIKLCIAILLLVIIYQDFKYLAISWWTVPILFVLGIINGFGYTNAKLLFTGFAVNIAFLAFQFVLLSIYFTIKNKRLTNITKDYLGIGDILFFIFLAISFEPVHFILFFTASLLIVLILFIVLKSVHVLKNKHLPLAGGISIVYIIFIIIAVIYSYNPYHFIPLNMQFV